MQNFRQLIGIQGRLAIGRRGLRQRSARHVDGCASEVLRHGLVASPAYIGAHNSEALEAINEAESVAERFEHGDMFSQLHRLRAVFLAATGAEETQIEASFCAAIRTAKEQKSNSLATRAEATYAEYRRQKARALGGH